MKGDSMADEANDVEASEINLDDFLADEQSSDQKDSSPKKTEEPEAKAEEATEKDSEAKSEKPTEEEAPAEDSKEEQAAEETEGKSDEKADTEETEAETADGEKLAPKSQNRFQRLANENRELRSQVEQLTAQVYQPQSVDELTQEVNPETGENYSRAEAAVAAMEQKLELKDYQERVTNAQMELGVQAQEVLNDFPAFNPKSDQYDEELASDAAVLLEQSLIRDPNVPEIGPDGQPTGKGIVIGSNIPPYQLYKTLSRTSSVSEAKGQIKRQQANEDMSASVDPASSTAPPKKAKDPLMELWSGEL